MISRKKNSLILTKALYEFVTCDFTKKRIYVIVVEELRISQFINDFKFQNSKFKIQNSEILQYQSLIFMIRTWALKGYVHRGGPILG